MNTEFWAISFPAPGSAIRTAPRIEAEGWDGLLFTDSQHHNADVYQALAVAATVTETIGLGTGVTNPVTRNAAVTAAAIASLQVQSNGRAVLGIGRGDSSLGHLGLKPAPVAVLEDYLIKVQGYLRGEAVVQNDHAAHLKWLPEDQPKVPAEPAAASLAFRSSGVSATSCALSEVCSFSDRLRTRVDASSEAHQTPIDGRAVSGLPVA